MAAKKSKTKKVEDNKYITEPEPINKYIIMKIYLNIWGQSKNSAANNFYSDPNY